MLLEKEKAVKNVANIFQSLKPGGPAPIRLRPHLHPMIRRSQNPNHREQWERPKKRHLSSQLPIRKGIQKTKRGKGKGDGK